MKIHKNIGSCESGNSISMGNKTCSNCYLFYVLELDVITVPSLAINKLKWIIFMYSCCSVGIAKKLNTKISIFLKLLLASSSDLI